MKIEKDFKETKNFSPERTEKLYENIMHLLQDAKPTVAELIIILSNTILSVGASIGGYGNKDIPSVQELEKIYYSEPNRIDIALMLQAFLMSSWLEALEKQTLSDNKEKG